MPASPSTPAPLTAGVGHYENFPVASWLCPPALRPAVTAIYHFARAADDMADEGTADAAHRLAQLGAYRQALQSCLDGSAVATQAWPDIFGPLAQAVHRHRLPGEPLHNLLSAFEQDVRHTAKAHMYADTAELMAYCQLSAHPVGRLLLHLYGIADGLSLQQSDAICGALQLINFWQDISVDHRRGRHYIPADALARHDLCLADFGAHTADALDPRRQALVAELCQEARDLMHRGAPLARRIPGRAGWELRLVVQGGLRILDKIAAAGYCSWRLRPTLGKADVPLLLWRTLKVAA